MLLAGVHVIEDGPLDDQLGGTVPVVAQGLIVDHELGRIADHDVTLGRNDAHVGRLVDGIREEETPGPSEESQARKIS